MSAANAAARARRAGGAVMDQGNNKTNTPQRPGTAPASASGSGLTLPQVIALVDTRLIKLESFMKETQDFKETQITKQAKLIQETQEKSDSTTDMLEEFNGKFEVLANELADLKDVVLKLQSYTMEVNKSLLETNASLKESGEALSKANKALTEANLTLTEANETLIEKFESAKPVVPEVKDEHIVSEVKDEPIVPIMNVVPIAINTSNIQLVKEEEM